MEPEGLCQKLQAAAAHDAAPLVPPLQLVHSGVTWSHQLDGDTIRRGGLATQPSSAIKADYKARESVSMYLEDNTQSLQVVEALQQK